jgi:glycosyltransferase involved in cell wall biosynthesis
MIDVDFSFATHNRTGKYFIGRDIIQDNANKIDRLLYWRYSTAKDLPPPSDLSAKVIGRLAKWEIIARLESPVVNYILPKIRRIRPVLHLDPYSTLCHNLTSADFVLCHDIGPISHPDLFAPEVCRVYAKIYSDIADVKPNMIYMSVATRDAFRSLFPGSMASERIIYAPLRAEILSSRVSPIDVSTPFILTVGSVGRRKNNLRTIQAFEKSGLAARNISLVICGGQEPGYEEVVRAAAKSKSVKLLSYVSDQELNWLYRNAIGFVLPSLLEGFGVPVAEAAAANLVPLVSEKSVLQEVAGEGAILVDPYSIQDIAMGMLHLVDMPDDERFRRKEMLKASVARFTRSAFREAWAATLA